MYPFRLVFRDSSHYFLLTDFFIFSNSLSLLIFFSHSSSSFSSSLSSYSLPSHLSVLLFPLHTRSLSLSIPLLLVPFLPSSTPLVPISSTSLSSPYRPLPSGTLALIFSSHSFLLVLILVLVVPSFRRQSSLIGGFLITHVSPRLPLNHEDIIERQQASPLTPGHKDTPLFATKAGVANSITHGCLRSLDIKIMSYVLIALSITFFLSVV